MTKEEFREELMQDTFKEQAFNKDMLDEEFAIEQVTDDELIEAYNTFEELLHKASLHLEEYGHDVSKSQLLDELGGL